MSEMAVEPALDNRLPVVFARPELPSPPLSAEEPACADVAPPPSCSPPCSPWPSRPCPWSRRPARSRRRRCLPGGPARGASRSSRGQSVRRPASLRAPVTDENFYFVMADRFENGSTANDTRRHPGRPSAARFRPHEQGLLQRRRPEGSAGQDRLHPRASAPPRSGSPRASRTRRSNSRTARRRATTGTGSPTSPRSTRTWAPTTSCRRWSTRRTGAG